MSFKNSSNYKRKIKLVCSIVQCGLSVIPRELSIAKLLNEILSDKSATDLVKTFATNNKINLGIAKEFLSISFRDLNASKILFESLDYANALYHLQQAIEKMAKAHAILFFPLSHEEIRNTSHVSPKLFIKLLTKNWSRPLLNKFSKIFPSLDYSLLDGVKNLSDRISSKKGMEEVAALPLESITNFLKVAEVVVSKVENLNMIDLFERIFGENWRNEVKDMITDLWSKVTPETPLSLDQKNMIKNMSDSELVGLIDERSKTALAYFRLGIPLYVLSILTFPHEAFSRYPGNNIAPKNYTEEMGIVKAFDQALELSYLMKGDLEILIKGF